MRIAVFDRQARSPPRTPNCSRSIINEARMLANSVVVARTRVIGVADMKRMCQHILQGFSF